MKIRSEKILLIIGCNMDYQEVKFIKSTIKETIKGLERISQEKKLTISENDKNLYIFLIKHIIFFEHILNSYPETFSLRVLTTDIYYLIVNDMKQNDRYSRLHERSIIENYIRLIIKSDIYVNNIDITAFNELKDNCIRYGISEDEVNAIYSAYKESCSYIHGGKILEGNLPKIFSEVFSDKISNKKNKNIQNNRIIKYITYLDSAFIISNKEVVSNSFHRRKSVLDALLTKNRSSLLF